MANKKIHPAKNITVNLENNQTSICLHYQIDNDYIGDLIAEFPFNITNINKNLVNLYGFFGSIFLAQLCLASEIEFTFPIPEYLISMVQPIIRNLYAVRSYRDKLEVCLMPSFINKAPFVFWEPYQYTLNKKAVSAWSGGLDSTLAQVLLQENNYEIFPLHIRNINADAAQSEFQAIKKLSQILGYTSQKIDIIFSQYFEISKKYSNKARDFPDINSVPHGRELILLPLSIIYACQVKASNICFGFEHSTWTEQFTLHKETFSRFDTQSQSSFVILQKIINKFISSQIKIFSPIAAITEYKKFSLIVTKYPKLAKNSSFCYWGNSCGLCRKCSLYYIFQRSLGENIISFKNNPILSRSTFIQEAMLNWDNPNSRDSNYALARIIEAGYIFNGEELLSEYERNIFPKVKPLLNEWQKFLTSPHQVDLIPGDFHI